jgi:hypothetical protein
VRNQRIKIGIIKSGASERKFEVVQYHSGKNGHWMLEQVTDWFNLIEGPHQCRINGFAATILPPTVCRDQFAADSLPFYFEAGVSRKQEPGDAI